MYPNLIDFLKANSNWIFLPLSAHENSVLLAPPFTSGSAGGTVESFPVSCPALRLLLTSAPRSVILPALSDPVPEHGADLPR